MLVMLTLLGGNAQMLPAANRRCQSQSAAGTAG